MAYPLFHPASSAPDPLTLTEAEFRAAFPAESEHVEFKSGMSRNALQDAIVAFSNADGGVVLIGVNDDGVIVGKELRAAIADDIHEIAGNVHDPGRYAIAELSVDGTPITVISVARRVEGFAQTSSGRVMLRRGTLKVALIGDELRQFISARSLQRFEETETDVALNGADEELLAELAKTLGWGDERAERLLERGLLTSDGRLTIAGAAYLLPDPASTLGKAYVEVLRFPEGATDYDRRVEIRGPLHHQLSQATTFVFEELGSELVVLGVRRHDIPRLPLVVLREAIANALAHRSYELTGSCIRIELHPDRVVIASPGGLPEPVTVENMREAQAARNLRIISVLRWLGLAEDAGRGIDVMEDSMREELLDPPTFTDTGYAVEVTLPIRSPVAPQERAWVREVEARGMIESADRIVLIHAARGEVLTNSRVRELLNVDQFAAREALRRLRDAELLTQRGTRGGASYVLGPSLQPPAGLQLDESALENLVVELATEEPVTNATVRRRTGLDRSEALRLLDKLVKAGRLVREGRRRGTRYPRVQDAGGAGTDE